MGRNSPRSGGKEIRMPGNRRGNPGLGQPASGQDPAPECRRVPTGTASLYHWQGLEAGAKNAFLEKQRCLTPLHTIQGITAVIGSKAFTEHTELRFQCLLTLFAPWRLH